MFTLLALVVPPVVSSCSTTTTVCAGQCRAPYQLDVVFRKGTSLATAQAVVTACTSANPVVLGVTFSSWGRGWAVVKTSQIGTAKTRVLIECLRKAPSVSGAGFPA